MTNSQGAIIETAQAKLTGAAKSFWKWLINRDLEAEHLLVVAVIILSTWHVGHYMQKAEGHWIIASVMGAVLGACNALFAMRFFEDLGETRAPALVGMVFFAGVSTWLQYGFYDENHGVTDYTMSIFGLFAVNLNALVQGAWAPMAEMLIGWLYGKRLQKSRGELSLIDKMRSEMQNRLDELTGKLTRQLTVEQGLRDQLYQSKLDHQSQMSVLQSSVEREGAKSTLLQSKIDELAVQVTELRVTNASLSATVNTAQDVIVPGQRQPVKHVSTDRRLTPAERQRMIADFSRENAGFTIQQLMDLTGAARNTVKEDMKVLGLRKPTGDAEQQTG